MKTTFRSLLFLAFAILLSGGTMYAQEAHMVTLYVDLDRLNQGTYGYCRAVEETF